jgi:hypothetical protein
VILARYHMYLCYRLESTSLLARQQAHSFLGELLFTPRLGVPIYLYYIITSRNILNYVHVLVVLASVYSFSPRSILNNIFVGV